MISILADTSPDAGALKSWLEVLFYIVGGVTAAVLLLGQLRGEKREIMNSPLEVRAHPGSVSRDELKQVHGRIERERGEIDAQIAVVRAEASRRLDKLESKIDDNTTLTAEMRGIVGQMNQTVSKVETSLTQYLQRQGNR